MGAQMSWFSKESGGGYLFGPPLLSLFTLHKLRKGDRCFAKGLGHVGDIDASKFHPEKND